MYIGTWTTQKLSEKHKRAADKKNSIATLFLEAMECMKSRHIVMLTTLINDV